VLAIGSVQSTPSGFLFQDEKAMAAKLITEIHN
jgi:hypothetical protein